ncbi:MAG: NAD(P)H-dependent oxidoreductase [Candidatus Brocadiia bacterium]
MESCLVLVIFDSDKGGTRLLANELAAGASEVNRIRVDVKSTSEVTLKEIVAADAYAFGTPNHFGTMSAPMKVFFRRLRPLWQQGTLRGRPACVFTASGKNHGGAETALLTTMLPLFAHGMLMVGLPPFPRKSSSEGSFLGAISYIDHSVSSEPDEGARTSARLLGERLARTVLALKAGREEVKEYIVDETRPAQIPSPDAHTTLEEIKRLIEKGEVRAWRCANCGLISEGGIPPESCPVCNLGVQHFTPYEVDAWECISCGRVVYSSRPDYKCPICNAEPDKFIPYSG